MTYEFIQVRREGHLTLVTLHRPEVLNALQAEAHWELHEAFDAGLAGRIEPLVDGPVVLLPRGAFSAALMLDAIQRVRAHTVVLVGAAFATPLLEALKAEPRRRDLSSVRLWRTSGAMLSGSADSRTTRRRASS